MPSFTSWRSRSAISSAARCRRCSVSIICRVVKRSSPRPSLPSSTRSGASAHRAHDLVELLDPVAVPMRKLRHVAPGEGRLLMGDRVQRKGWIGDDPRAIAARDLAVHLGAVGLDPFARDRRPRCVGGRTDLALRLQRDALRLQAAMVDARVDVEFGQALIGEFRPALAPALDQLGAVPVPHLRAKTVLVHRAHGQHDMGMRLGAAVLRPCPSAH